MKKKIIVTGYSYRLRPVCVKDAKFIIDTRLEDAERNKYIHRISSRIEDQEQWISVYLERDDDYYFIVENIITGEAEGLIGIYDIANGSAEWGRWVIRKASFAAVESVDLIYQAAFDQLGLNELYCRTLCLNETVVSFHDSIGQKNGGIIKDCFTIEGSSYDAVRHYVDRQYYYDSIQDDLQNKALRIFERNMKLALGEFTFHHIGVATKNMERELNAFRMLNYKKEAPYFEDANQGIGGQFVIAKGQPRLELLVNLPDSETLSPILAQGGKLYHFGYQVGNFDKAMEIFGRFGARVMSQPKQSTYFGKRISFLMMKNLFLIELIEHKQ